MFWVKVNRVLGNVLSFQQFSIQKKAGKVDLTKVKRLPRPRRRAGRNQWCSMRSEIASLKSELERQRKENLERISTETAQWRVFESGLEDFVSKLERKNTEDAQKSLNFNRASLTILGLYLAVMLMN